MRSTDMGRPRLTKKQKQKNRAEYNRIRRIYNKIDNPDLSYKEFKDMVYGLNKGTKETIKETAKRVAHSQKFVSAERVGKENILTGLKENFRDVYDELRYKAGKFEKGEHLIERLKWNDSMQAYTMTSSTGATWLIDITNSPKNAQLIRL